MASGCAIPQSVTDPASSTRPVAVDKCVALQVSSLEAEWRPADEEERANAEWTMLDYSSYEHVFLLRSVAVRLTNHSTSKAWVTGVNIENSWTDENGKPERSKYMKYAGWYASVVPKPASSNDSNPAKYVNPGESIEFKRYWDTLGFYPDAEIAVTDGTVPKTTVPQTYIDWWSDDADTKRECEIRESESTKRQPG